MRGLSRERWIENYSLDIILLLTSDRKNPIDSSAGKERPTIPSKFYLCRYVSASIKSKILKGTFVADPKALSDTLK